MRKRVLSGSVSAVLLVGALAAVAAPAGALTNCTVPAAEQAIDAEEQELLVLVNDYRASRGVRPLSFNPDLNRAAAWMSRDMASRNVLPSNHVDSAGRDIGTRLTQCDVPWTAYAENLYAGSPDAQDVFTWWRNSSSHNTNMLRPEVSLAGIGRAFNAAATFGWYWTLDLTAPPATVIVGSTWYTDGTNAKTGAPGTTVRAYAVGAYQNLSYRLVLATGGCTTTVAVLNPNTRFANSAGFISTTVGTIPVGTPAGQYDVCFKTTPDISYPTATGTVGFTVR